MANILPVFHNAFDDMQPRIIKSTDNIFGNFLTNNGLYDEIEISNDNVFELADLIGGHVKIDIYCPECKENRVFSCEEILYYWYDESNEQLLSRKLEDEIVSWQRRQRLWEVSTEGAAGDRWSWTNNFIEEDTRVMVFKFICAMDNTHRLDYIVLTSENKMKKIGQYPSVADLTFPELKEYRKILSEEDERELKRAIGLFASGIGVGSFVYLRRIFERIIGIASQKAFDDKKVDQETFNRAKIEEKIKMLSDYLPKFLIDNHVFYGIVSKGIHELSEEECINYFPVMKDCIIMILRQWEKMRKDQEDEEKIAKAINRISSNLE